MVEAALAEADAPVDVRPVDIRTGAQRDPEYLAVNPHGKLPALITPDGELLTETWPSCFPSKTAIRMPD